MNNFKPKYIVVHYSATATGSAKSFERYHKTVNGWMHLGYHYVLTRDGAIENINGEGSPGIHAPSFNNKSIAICLVYKDGMNVTKFQKRNLVWLCHSLMSRYGIKAENIIGHNEAMTSMGKPEHTSCPGRAVDMVALRRKIEETRNQFKEFVLLMDS